MHFSPLLFSSPENVPRLFDLVRPKDPRYLTAFYYALRNTLVGKDLEQATRIGLQGKTRYRVVTLSGQVVDIAGNSFSHSSYLFPIHLLAFTSLLPSPHTSPALSLSLPSPYTLITVFPYPSQPPSSLYPHTSP